LIRPPYRRPAVALAAAAFAVLTACSDGAPAPRAAPSGSPGAADVPTEAAVRAQTADLLARYDLDVASFMVTDGHLGYYLRPKPGWPVDEYVRQLPDAAETARALLARYPALVDVDVCVDGPWLPHGPDKTFVPASRVLLKRADAARWPARFTDPADVLVAGLDEQSVEYFLDARVLESRAYAAATRELARRRAAS
jgi:hypothetical protein